MHVKRIQGPIIAGLLLLMLILPQLALADIVPGSISVTDITETSAEIAWTTNTTSDSRVNYGTTTALGQTKYDATMVNNHNVILTGLTQDTTHYFEVISDGERSPVNPSQYYSFKTLAPATYSLTLEPACGVCGDLIEVQTCSEVIGVTAAVPAAGTYHICWDSAAATNVKATFTATVAGIYTTTFFLPEAAKGLHTVHLTDNAYASKATATFEVLPSAKIDPVKGPADTTVTLNVYGFAASREIRVTLFQGAVQKGDVKTGTTNSVGSWTTTYIIPHTPAGGYTFAIESREGTVWVAWVSKYFQVTPKITANPTSGKVGQTISISGTGFAQNEKNVQVTFEGEVRAVNIPVDEKGSWNTDIILPPRQGGTYSIGASGAVTRARDVSPIDFVLSAGILVEPSQAYVGDTITVKGGGFRPGETGIRVTFGGQFVTPTITANSNGSWEGSFVLPPSPYGGNTVTARGDVTTDKTATLTVKARIESLSPVEGAPGDTVTLTGSGFGSSKTLSVTIGAVAATQNLQSQFNGNVAISFPVPKGAVIGKQTLKVDDGAGGFDEVDFTVKEKILSIVPLPISPKDNTLRSGEVTFNWQGITGSTGYTYTMEISESPGGGSTGSPKSGIAESSYTLTENEVLPKGTYYWRVKIVDDYGNEGPWSDSIQFKVSPIPTWVWVVVGLVVLVALMVVAYRETKFKVTE